MATAEVGWMLPSQGTITPSLGQTPASRRGVCLWAIPLGALPARLARFKGTDWKAQPE